MAASSSDLLTQATTNSRPSPTQVSSTRSSGGATLACLALTGWPTLSGVHFITYKVNTSGAKIAGSQCDWEGVVSGTNITNIVLKAGTDVGNAVGDIVEAAPTAAYANGLYSWGSAHADPTTGALLTSAVQTALSLGTGALNGWNVLAFTPATVTANGNRSYSLVFNGQDLTGTLSPGMRFRTTRTVAAPTQCTSLNGTSQYYSKTSPAGMTFTNNFVVSAWVKLTSYGSSAVHVATRYNGTSGWNLQIEADGRVTLGGYNGGAGNVSYILSYQSIPLNKWVHIAAQLDMSTFTATPTTSYIMIDGVDVPASVARAGTNPTALVQAGNLEIGSWNGGLQPFPGKIAQVAIYGAKVTQATINASKDQSLAGTETSLISAYSFNNTVNDLNTTNANNLTANGSAVATNADSPYGGQADSTISSTLDYGIVQKATFSTNTTVVVHVAEGCTIPTTGGVSAVAYSPNKEPYGFPGQRGKWQLIMLSKIAQSAAGPPTSGTFVYFNHALSLPIGEWALDHSLDSFVTSASAGSNDIRGGLSVSTSTPTADELTFFTRLRTSGTTEMAGHQIKRRIVSIATVTPYYFLIVYSTTTTTTSAGSDNSNYGGYIAAENAYL